MLLGLLSAFSVLSPQEVADKWVARAGAASSDYARGVETTDKDPTALAARSGERYIAGVTEAYRSGRWARALQQVGKAGWQQAVAAKGVANYTTGVNAAREKFAAAIGPVLTAVQAGQRIVDGMPNTTEQQRDQRALAFINHMRQFRKNR